ncbi:alpha/beta fold hydrolase [Aquabacterium sp. OR-4]|uniref:alpha/beta fold hydrolase n=1 Tax=Aquabacterium sp. OR-4 TaxID=2978127 RepID=UPI0021B3C391|nr:alpha/beta fold hydrolase [Aquabacterium sp. OR-4]MDT7834729.1 alpha/beta fold hydrolase [Aquabacterium sp. OR-4]
MRISANGIAIEVDIQGPPGGEPLLLIMGLGMQLTGWPDELVADLAGRGYRVIRFDNRDAGLSQRFDEAGMPSLWRAALRHTLQLHVPSPYRLRDMADDSVGVLDALGIERAHVCGASMGGMIAQHVAARHPARVKSLALIMTTSGHWRLPQPGWTVRQALLRRPRSNSLPDVVAHLSSLFGLIGSPDWRDDPARVRERMQAAVQRAWHPAGTARQLVAVAADGDRSPLLGQIHQPTQVIHGAADPLVPPAGGHDLARKIHGARLELIDGMGHDLPLALLPRIAALIATNAERAAA